MDEKEMPWLLLARGRRKSQGLYQDALCLHIVFPNADGEILTHQDEQAHQLSFVPTSLQFGKVELVGL
jgi:hypothetical protein